MNKISYFIALGVVVLIILGVVISKKQSSLHKFEEIFIKQGQGQKEIQPMVSAQELYDQAQRFMKEKNRLEARNFYKKIYTEYPDFELIEQVQANLENLNIKIILSNIPTKETAIHQVVSGDTLGKLAKQYGTTIDLIKRSNRLKSDVIRIGQRLRIWKGQFDILVDKSQNILILKSDGEVVKVYVVSTGEESSTPTGQFRITSKLVDPVWFNRGAIVPPESPQNVLGSRWLGFNLRGYGIHGTIEPETMGKSVTAGCVRMRNKDVEEIYSIIPLGVKVVITE